VYRGWWLWPGARRAGASLTAQGRADVGLCLAEPVGGPCPRRSEPREALGEDAAGAVEQWANEAADGDLEPDAPAETGQVVEPAGIPAVHAACIVAAEWASRRWGGGRQVDGEVLDIKTGTDEAAPFGGAQ